ncbi:ABC transporter permease [Eubacteriaceae bacterium ES2]|nr:ABC transporter permease [Eubacteriaceae bacterium ES2]
MRLKIMLLNEFRFLWKYGIIALYVVFTLIYLGLLAALPTSVREITAVLLVFTDPAAMGLFFMGAVVLLEKSQHVESSLSVSPIKIEEYIIAKIIPMMIIACLVALALCLYAHVNIILSLIGVAFSSVLFSLCGLSVGVNIKSLNSFMIATVPFEIILCLPPLLYLFGLIQSPLWLIHPGVSAIALISGQSQLGFPAILSIVFWIFPVFVYCKKAAAKSFISLEGIKL